MRKSQFLDSHIFYLHIMRIKQGLKQPELMSSYIPPDQYIMTVALFNDNVVDVAYNMFHALPVLTPDAKFPDLPSQGLFNWVSFEGEPYRKKNKMEYTQALGLFNFVLFDTFIAQRIHPSIGDESKAKEEYEDWLKRNERYRPESNPLNPYNPSNPYDYRNTPMQRTNQYGWNSPATRSPQFDFRNPQFKKDYDK